VIRLNSINDELDWLLGIDFGLPVLDEVMATAPMRSSASSHS
jgi:hypothetical protein